MAVAVWRGSKLWPFRKKIKDPSLLLLCAKKKIGRYQKVTRVLSLNISRILKIKVTNNEHPTQAKDEILIEAVDGGMTMGGS